MNSAATLGRYLAHLAGGDAATRDLARSVFEAIAEQYLELAEFAHDVARHIELVIDLTAPHRLRTEPRPGNGIKPAEDMVVETQGLRRERLLARAARWGEELAVRSLRASVVLLPASVDHS